LETAKEPVVVACTADEGYVMPLAAMLTSLVAHLDGRRALHIYVIDGGIRPADRHRLADSLKRPNVSLEWVPSRSRSRPELPAWGRLQPAVYERLAIPDYLPDSVRKVIWLDCDLVLERDLSPLWDTDIGDRYALAVQDMIVPYVSSPMGVARHTELGIASSSKYFNAGVMSVNLALWREHRVAEQVMDYLERHWKEVFFLEQEGLNVVLAGKWGELDPRWNQNAGVSGRSFYRPRHLDRATYERVVNDPWIVHFTGNLKPWGAYGDPRSSAIYFRYLDATPWAGHRPRRGIRHLLLKAYETARLRDALYRLEKRAIGTVRRVSRRRSRRQSRDPASGQVGTARVGVVTDGD
jgi:lipopolysaccharide biosynthesis glycosyltransferase